MVTRFPSQELKSRQTWRNSLPMNLLALSSNTKSMATYSFETCQVMKRVLTGEQWFIYPLLVFVWIAHVIKLVICKFVMTQRLSSSLSFHHRCSLVSSLLLHSCFIYICCSSTGTLYSANLFVAFGNYRRILIRSSRTVSSALFRKKYAAFAVEMLIVIAKNLSRSSYRWNISIVLPPFLYLKILPWLPKLFSFIIRIYSVKNSPFYSILHYPFHIYIYICTHYYTHNKFAIF